MYSKIKNQNKDEISLTAKLGITLMSIATTFGMVDLPSHLRAQITVPTARPAYAYVNESNDKTNSLQRVREDTETNYVSYSVSQRTPARSGRR
jgi:hypothetical protein